MARFSLAGDTGILKFTSWFNNQVGLVTSHWRAFATTGTGISDQEFADFMGTNGGPIIRSLMANVAQYLGCSVKILSSLPLPVSAVSLNQNGNGVAGANPLPTQTAGGIGYYTRVAGRAGRGRNYLPFPSTTAITAPDETPNVAYKVQLAAFMVLMTTPTTIVGAGGSADMRLIICPRSGVGGNEVVRGVVRQLWQTQRRRGDSGRPNPPVVQL